MKHLENATERLAKGVNEMYEENKTKDLISLVKRQVDEIDRRGQIIMKMEDSIKLQQINIQKLQEQNKHLEAMVEDIRIERHRLLEEIENLKTVKITKPRTRRKKIEEKEGDATEAA